MEGTAAAGLITPIAEEIGKSIITSLKREINYFCCFSDNVRSFREQVQKLEDDQTEVEQRVDTAKRNGKPIVPKVDTWLKEVAKYQVTAKKTEADIPKKKGCLNMLSLSRFSFSKRAKKTAEDIEKLRCEGNFDTVSSDPPPPAVDLSPLRDVIPFPSRNQVEDDIVKALSVPEANIVGIGGMGGVGKTTMAEKIMHRMKKENLVDETFKVVVSKPIDMLKIQRDIAEYIGCSDLKKLELLQVRAHKLRISLTRGKKILIVLDDIWEEFKLEDVGIPCESGSSGCITLLTSRDRGLLNLMGAKVYAVETLRDDEAWTLFRKTTGTCVDNPDLGSTPRDIVSECKGLPIAIVAIGKSLIRKSGEAWEDALSQLKAARPDNLPKFLNDVYMPLKVSYDDLFEYKGGKSLFLLCCLFPEDYCISLEELTSYSFGLDIFELYSLEETRNRVLTVVEELKRRYMLLDCEDRNRVKMHDVVRDVAIFIATEEGIIDSKHPSKVQSSDRSCQWISMFTSPTNESFHGLRGRNFPSLGLLCMQHTSNSEPSSFMKIDDLAFLESMQKLNVLSLAKIKLELPPAQSTKLLKNLRTLRLVDCNLESISVVGELLSLEILICFGCHMIEELPMEIRRLKRLKLLDISRCSKLQRIEPGIISELIELEELKMLESFNDWESTKVDSKERKRNVSIEEIELLHKLTILEIEIKDVHLAKEEIHLPTSIVKYKVFIGERKHFETSKNKLRGLGDEILVGSSNFEEEIMKALSAPEVSIVGIGGMGGVGKTTMAEKIMHRMKTENLVDETVYVVVSQPIDMFRIQRDIAEYVGNKDLKGVESLQVRAQKLRTSLTRGKKILIVLDDIWEEFKLEDVGIPCESGSGGCITLLTSRNRGLLERMGAKFYEVGILRPEAAWILFRETTGTRVDDPYLGYTAQQLVKECNGLPIAIITIGKSLKDKPKKIWDVALHQLKIGKPVNLPRVLEDVYMPIKFSYDQFEYEGCKLLFLLCCLFPEDYRINLEELTSYSFGLGMFGVDSLEETRNRVFTVVEELKSRYLLLGCEDRNHVKMHDVVRDVAIYIASEEGIIDSKHPSEVQSGDRSCKWISMFNTDVSFDALRGCNFPSLRLLCIQDTSYFGTLEINDLTFLRSMKKLNVLSLRNFTSKLPSQSTKLLKNLRTLRLVGCNLESISLVGELSSLEVLICLECKEIEELPIEIRRLKHLKLLNISGCSKLQRIEPGIISELIELEEVKMIGSFNGWESTKVDNQLEIQEQKRNASIEEIEVLHKLVSLEIEINDINLAKEEVLLPKGIVKYKVFIGGGKYKTYEHEKVVQLRGLTREIRFGSWIRKLASTTEALHLDGSANINLLQAYKTAQALLIENCTTMKELFLTSSNQTSKCAPDNKAGSG